MPTNAEIKLILETNSATKALYDSLKTASAGYSNEFKDVVGRLNDAAAKQMLSSMQRNGAASVKLVEQQYNALNQQLQDQIKLYEQSSGQAKIEAMLKIRKAMEGINRMSSDDFSDKMQGGFRAALLNRDTMIEFGKELTTTVEQSFSRVDLDSFKGIGVGILGQIQKGAAAQAKSFAERKSMAEAAGDTAGAAKMGEAAMAMGLLAGSLAVVAGAMALFVGYVVAADEYLSKMNQTLIEGASYGDILSKSMADSGATLEDTLGAARRASNSVAMAFGMSADETSRALSELAQAGLKYTEITKDARTPAIAEARFRTELTKTLAVSKAMGISVQEVSQYRNTLNTELNMPLEQTVDVFGMIDAAARASGMSTRTFFTAISQATSGMALYNVRVEDAVGLIGKFSKTVGETDAAEAFKDATKGAEGTSEERLKRILMATGGDATKLQGFFAKASGRAVAGFQSRFQNDGVKVRAALGNDLGSALLDPSRQKEAAAKLRDLTQVQVEDLFLRLEQQVSPEAAREFRKVAGVAAGGRADLESQAMATKYLSQSEQMGLTAEVIKLFEAQGVQIEDALRGKGSVAAEKAIAALGIDSEGTRQIFAQMNAQMRQIDDIRRGKGTEQDRSALESAGFTVQGNSVMGPMGQMISDVGDLAVAISDIAASRATPETQTQSEGQKMAASVSTIATIMETWSRNKLFENSLTAGRGYIWKWAKQALGDELQAPNLEQIRALNSTIMDTTEKRASELSTKAEQATTPEESAALMKEAERVRNLGQEVASMGSLGSVKFNDLIENLPSAKASPEIQRLLEERSKIVSDESQNAAGMNRYPSFKGADSIEQEILNLIAAETGVTVKSNFGESISAADTTATISAPAATPAQDFIYRPGMPIQKFSPNDTVFGIKHGGPLAGGGGGVTININGGDPAVVYSTVVKALRAAQKV